MNTPWHTRPMAAFDVETTGLDVEGDRIVTAALWRIDPARGTKDVTTWFADPGVEIPQAATEIHGITTERARAEGRPAVEVVTEIAAALERRGRSGSGARLDGGRIGRRDSPGRVDARARGVAARPPRSPQLPPRRVRAAAIR